MGTDMVDSCQEKKSFPATLFRVVVVVANFQDTQRGGTHLTTVDHSDIRGLATAGLGFVVELPQSTSGSFGRKAYSDRSGEGSPNRNRAPIQTLDGYVCSLINPVLSALF